jgi:hypothetical protein
LRHAAGEFVYDIDVEVVAKKVCNATKISSQFAGARVAKAMTMATSPIPTRK